MKSIHTTVDIAAAPGRVWEVLTDFSSYPQWNPFIRSISGTPEVGERLAIVVQPPGGSATAFKPVVLAARPGLELRWKGRLIMPGIFDGDHYFHLQELEGGTRLEHGERFSGLLAMLMPASSFGQIEAGFLAMNQALKSLAEG